jgi:hypothetical protein
MVKVINIILLFIVSCLVYRFFVSREKFEGNGYQFFDDINLVFPKITQDIKSLNSYLPPADDPANFKDPITEDPENNIIDSTGFFRIKNKYGLLAPFDTTPEM